MMNNLPKPKKMTRSMSRKTARRRGAVSIFVAGGAVMMLGFAALAVDFGIGVNDKNRLQRACDAGALAGASKLKVDPDDTVNRAAATSFAKAVTAENGVTVQDSQITFLNDSKAIRVSATIDRPGLFARVFGSRLGAVSAFAIAGVNQVSAKEPGVVPIGITLESYEAYKNDQLLHSFKQVRPTDTLYGKDNFITFDLRSSNAKSPAQMESQLKGTSFPNVNIGDKLTSLNASEGGFVEKWEGALSWRFQQSAGTPWFDSWTGNLFNSIGVRYNQIVNGTSGADNPRVMRLIINPNGGTPTGGGTFDVEIVKFANVYLESYNTTVNPLTGESSLTLNMRFLPDFGGTSNSGSSRTVTLTQ